MDRRAREDLRIGRASPRRLASGSGASRPELPPDRLPPRSVPVRESSTTLALGLEERAYLSASVARRELDRAEEAARQERERTLKRRSVKCRRRSSLRSLPPSSSLPCSRLSLNRNRRRVSRVLTSAQGTRELASAASANLGDRS